MLEAVLKPTSYYKSKSFWIKALVALALGLYVAVIGASVALAPAWISLLLVAPLLLPLFANNSLRAQVSTKTFQALFFIFLFTSLVWPKLISINLGGPDIRPQRITLIALLALLAYAAMLPIMRSKLQSAVSEYKVWFFALSLLFVHRLASCINSDYFFATVFRLTNELLTVGLVCVFTSLIARNSKFIEKYLKSILAIAILLSIMAVIEFSISRNLFASIVLPGMQIDSEFRDSVVAAKLRGGTYRSQVTFTHPLQLTEFALACLPLMLPLVWSKVKRHRVAGLVGLCALLICLVLSGSRAGYVIGFGTALLMVMASQMAAFKGKRSSWMLWAGLIVVSVLSVIVIVWALESGHLGSFIGGRSLEERQSSEARLSMLRMAWPLIEAEPVFGYGLGLGAFVLGFQGHSGLTIDSYWLSYSLESGLLGLFLFSFVCLLSLYRGAIQAKKSSPWHALCIYSLMASVISVLTFKTILSLNDLDFLLFINLALLATSSKWADQTHWRKP